MTKSFHQQFCAPHGNFSPVCSYITKEDCAKARRESSASQSTSPICDRVHFKPLIRPHTDPSLGHCSYLNTCYSEPTYAQSPSIPPFPSGNATRVSLPSGLGAGGRGKEKAPCRYLHFEVDWDEKDGQVMSSDIGWKEAQRMRNPFKLAIGMGPDGKAMQTVCPYFHWDCTLFVTVHPDSCLPNGSTATFDGLIIQSSENSMSSWRTPHGIFT